MTLLSALNLKTTYHKGLDDIAAEFYLPCMGAATKYDRAVGYFSSTIYIIAWPSLRDFVQRGGRMKIICSPALSPADVDAISEGYGARSEPEAATRLREEVSRLLADPFLTKPTRVVASLVALGIIEFKVAFIKEGGDPKSRRLFHDKTGIFADSADNAVVFKGSMNETWTGLSADGNIESVDVYVSWLDAREGNRVRDEQQYFDRLWVNDYPTAVVRDFPQIARDELTRAADAKNWPDLVDEICREMDASRNLSADRKLGGRDPLPHQTRAIEAWLTHGRRGILEHATGSGKTFTALCAIRDALNRGEVPLILVPSELLLKQWTTELSTTLSDLGPDLLLCGAGNTRWRDDRLLKPWTRPRVGTRRRIVLSTMQTAATDDFRGSIECGQHVFMVADEVHRMGSPEHQKLFDLQTGPRLGLSATPRRAGDPEGTAALFGYFGGVVPPPFTLMDAIRANALTPYFYSVHLVTLTDDEKEEWEKITARIRKLLGMHSKDGERGAALPMSDPRVRNLLIQRASIAKGASAKAPKAVKILRDTYTSGQRWIVYCDAGDQLRNVLAGLLEAGLPAGEYHSAMAGDREQTLRHFEANGGILVSIRCLDEGVDIPSVTHALILASSKNPREFIQRRGRVLRKFPGKTLAYVHDVLVEPADEPDDNGEDDMTSLLEGELARAVQFGRSAQNPSAITDIERIAVRHSIDVARLLEGGFEDDE